MYHIIETKSNNVQDPETGAWSVTSDVVTPIPQYADRDKAISQWHWKCVYGADPELSGCDIHDVLLLDHTGGVVMHECFYHGQQPVEEEPQEKQQEEPVEGIEEPSEEPVEEVEEEPSEEPVAEEPIDEPIEEEPVEEEPEEGDGE